MSPTKMPIPPSIKYVVALLWSVACVPATFAGVASPTPGPISIATIPSTALTPEQYELKPRTVAFVMSAGSWDDAAALLDTAFKSIYASLSRQGVHSIGPPMVEYLDSDDTTFSFRAIVPIDVSGGVNLAALLGPAVQVGDGPVGKVLKFVHQGSFDDLEQVYNRIDDYLAARDLGMERVVEEYVTDQAVTPPESTITNIYVFTK